MRPARPLGLGGATFRLKGRRDDDGQPWRWLRTTARSKTTVSAVLPRTYALRTGSSVRYTGMTDVRSSSAFDERVQQEYDRLMGAYPRVAGANASPAVQRARNRALRPSQPVQPVGDHPLQQEYKRLMGDHARVAGPSGSPAVLRARFAAVDLAPEAYVPSSAESTATRRARSRALTQHRNLSSCAETSDSSRQSMERARCSRASADHHRLMSQHERVERLRAQQVVRDHVREIKDLEAGIADTRQQLEAWWASRE